MSNGAARAGSHSGAPVTRYGEKPVWAPRRPHIGPIRLAVSWVVATVALLVAAWILPGAEVRGFWGALVAAAVIAVLNAILPPLIAALRLPLMLVFGLLLVLIADALMLLAADRITDGDLSVDSFWSALGVALVASAVTVVLDVLLGTNDDDAYTLRVIQRIARRSGERVETDAPGILFLEIDGLALPVLQRAMRDGNAPNMARWLEDEGYVLTEWETDLSSQTGASQAGILLGSNDDIPAFRWVEKETATMMTCSTPADCEEIERRHAGNGLLRRRRREPRQSPLGGGRPRDPDRQPAGGREEGESRLQGIPRQRLQRDPPLRPLLLGDRARARRVEPGEASRCAPSWPSRWSLPAHARGPLRLRSRPDRLRRAPGHDERTACDLRDLLELRRGRAPLGPRARRHARGAPQAR